MKNYAQFVLPSILTFFFCMTIFGVQGVAQSNSSSKKLRFEPYTVEFSQSNFKTLTVRGVEAEKLTPFEVENPHRLVLDLPRKVGKFLKESTFRLSKSTCPQSIRIGNHPQKTRIVIDLASKCDFSIKNSPGFLEIEVFQSTNLPAQSSPTPTQTVAAVITELPSTPPATIPAQPSVTATFTAAPEPTSTLTPTVTATTELTIAPTMAPLATAATIPPTVTVLSRALQNLDFYHDGDINQIKLHFSQRVPFKTIKEAPRKYKISVPDCSLLNEGLTLPQFPPNDVVGFTLVRISKNQNSLEIMIDVEDGIKISAANVENTITISAEPAGF